jgi:hypothetical protein
MASKNGLVMTRKPRGIDVKKARGDEQARRDELGDDPGQVGPASAGQSGDPQDLSSIEDASNESVQELADSDQALEADFVDGIEDAADHPERPVHTHLEYGRPDDLPPQGGSDGLARRASPGWNLSRADGEAKDVDVEGLPDEKSTE